MNPDNQGAIPSSIGHDLKTPVTSIRMMLQLLAEQKVGELNEKQAFMVNQAKDDCERLIEVIERLVINEEATD